MDSSGVYVSWAIGFGEAIVRKYDVSGIEQWTRRFIFPISGGASGVAVDPLGGVYVVGSTAVIPPEQTEPGEYLDVFVRKYDANGNVLWIRQFGTQSLDQATGVAADASGVYVAGDTNGTLVGQTKDEGVNAFVRKYDTNGNVLWTRQFGTTTYVHPYAVAVDTTGVYIAGLTDRVLPGQTSAGGYDAFVRKYDVSGNLLWTSQFGTFATDYVLGVAAGGNGLAVVGIAYASLPGYTNAGGGDAFVRKYDANGNVLWTRQFGTIRGDGASHVAMDPTSIYVVGSTQGALPGQVRSGFQDAYVRKYDHSGSAQWTNQFGFPSGNSTSGAALDATGVYVAGNTTDAFPGSPTHGFVVKIGPLAPSSPMVNDGGVVNNASYALSPAPVAPGSIVAVFGSNLNDGSEVLGSSLGPDGKLVTTLGSASVTVGNIPAPLFYSTPGQLGVQIPFEVAGQTTATIQVTVGGQTSEPRAFILDAHAPGIFTLNGQGTGAAVILHQDGVTPVNTQSPARPGEVVVLYATGLGTVTPPLATGAPSTGNLTVATPTVTIDGIPGEVLFSGAAPGFAGLNQVNVRIPPSTRSAPDIPVVLSIGGAQSNSVTIAVGP